VLSPEAAALARNLLQQQDIRGGVWHVLDALPHGSQSWEDLLNAVAHLRRQKEWQRVIQVQTLIAVFSKLSLSLSLSLSVSLCLCLYLCTHVSLSLSLHIHLSTQDPLHKIFPRISCNPVCCSLLGSVGL